MTNVFKFLLAALVAILLACDKPQGPSFIIANDIYIKALNEDGIDLLDPISSVALDLSEVKVYYDLDGVKTEINRSNMDFPQMFLIEEPSENSDNYRILLFLNSEDDSNITTTYFEWNSSRTDVFKAMIERGQNGIINRKIWLNENLICDVEVSPGRCSVDIIIDN